MLIGKKRKNRLGEKVVVLGHVEIDINMSYSLEFRKKSGLQINTSFIHKES